MDVSNSLQLCVSFFFRVGGRHRDLLTFEGASVLDVKGKG